MAYKNNNILFTNLQRAEQQLLEINPHCQIEITMYGESVGEVEDARRQTMRRKGMDEIIARITPDKKVQFEYLHPDRRNILIRASTK